MVGKSMKTCPDCGCNVYNGHCVNCHEETYIYYQNQSNDEIIPMSQDFFDKVNKQEKETKKINKKRFKQQQEEYEYPFENY